MRAPVLTAALLFLLAGCGASDIATTPAGPGGVGRAGTGGSAAGTTGSGGAGAAGAAGAGGASGPTTVRITNFNVRNLFNDKIDSGKVLDEAGSTPTTAAYQQKLAATAGVIAATTPDLVALQEVENMPTLGDLADRPELGDAFPYRVLIDGNDPRGIDVALLSRFPIQKQLSHKDDLFTGSTSNGKQYKYARDLLEVHLSIGATRLVVLVAHFKAKLDDDPAKRLAEAEHSRAIADALAAGDPALAVIILGDFNDFPGSPPLNAIEGVLPARFDSSTVGLAPADRWSTEFNKQKLLHDDQRTNPALTALLVPGSAKILHDDELATQAQKDTSDHAPVSASYVLP